MKITTCPSCGSKGIKSVRQDWAGEHRGRKYVVPDLEFHACPECGERVYDREAMRRIQAESPAFMAKRSSALGGDSVPARRS